MDFVGRKKYFDDLNKIYLSNRKNKKSILIGVDGIRKVGKTTFVNEFVIRNKEDNDLFLFFIGNIHLKSVENIKECVSLLRRSFVDLLKSNFELQNLYKKDFDVFSKTYNNSYNWSNFFDYLNKHLSFYKKHYPNNYIFIFFDEISWYDKQGKFIAYFANYWNKYGVFEENLAIFMASSVSIWAKENAFMNKGALFERFNKIIKLEPFSIKEIKEVIRLQHSKINDLHIIYYYFIFGGIIKYYLGNYWLDFSLSFEDNLKKLSQRKDLLDEYNNLFQGILSDKKCYKEIIKLLCKSKSLSSKDVYSKIVNELKLSYSNQHISEQLNDLEAYSFIKKDVYGGENYYTINHSLSYFIYYWFDEKSKINWLSNLDQDFSTWKGNAFEIFLSSNQSFLIDNLPLEHQHPDVFLNWLYVEYKKKGKGFKKNVKAQIDLLIDKTDEMKRLSNEKDFLLIECKNYKENARLTSQDVDEIEKKIYYLESYASKNDNIDVNKIHIKPIVFSVQPIKIIEDNGLNIENISLINFI